MLEIINIEHHLLFVKHTALSIHIRCVCGTRKEGEVLNNKIPNVKKSSSSYLLLSLLVFKLWTLLISSLVSSLFQVTLLAVCYSLEIQQDETF